MSEPHSQSWTIYTMLMLTVLAFSWLYMQWTHELGHIIAGVATGAEVNRVILNPFRFSMTQFASNPRPHLTSWGGPILGVLIGAGLPVLLSIRCASARASLLIVAAFVLVANGLYIGLGALRPIADASDLLRHGTPRWVLVMFGLVCVIVARVLVIPAIHRAWNTSSLKCCWPFGILTLAMGATGFIFFG